MLLGLVLVASAAAGACVSDGLDKETTFVLQQLEQTEVLGVAIEFEGEVLVYPEDLSQLAAGVRAVDTLSGKEDLIADHLKKQERIDCILEDIEEAAEDEDKISCNARVLVEKDESSGLLAKINDLEGDRAKRAFLGTFVDLWLKEARSDRVVEALSQKNNVVRIPLFGRLINRVHSFPIRYEGEVVVPEKEVSELLDQYHALSTKEDRLKLVEGYLGERLGY